MDLENPVLFSHDATTTLEFADFPHALRFPHAEADGADSRLGSWELVVDHVRDYLQDSNWRHTDLIDYISVASPEIPRRVRGCRFPLYVTPLDGERYVCPVAQGPHASNGA